MTFLGLKRRIWLFLINNVYTGTQKFEKKRILMIKLGHEIGEGTKIVGPVEITGKLICGKNCWIGKNLKINGNGKVTIGDNCDIGPEVTFQTGNHEIGTMERRAGRGENCCQSVGSGTWIGGRATIIGNTTIGSRAVIAGCACVVKDVEEDTLVGGVPAKEIKKLEKK